MLNSVRGKILLAYMVAAGLVMIAAIFGIFSLKSGIDRFRNDVAAMSDAQVGILQIQVAFKTQVQEWKNVLLRGSDPAKLDKYWKEFEKEEAKVQESAMALSKQLPDGPARQLVNDFVAAHKQLGTDYRAGLEAYKQASFDHKAGDAKVSGKDRAPTEFLTKSIDTISKDANTMRQTVSQQAGSAIMQSMIAMLIASVLGLVGFYVLCNQSVCIPLTDVARHLEDITRRNDFTHRIAVKGQDEIASLGRGLNVCIERIQQALKEIDNASGHVTENAQNLSQAAQQLAQSTDQQSASVSNMAAALEQISTSLAHTADSAGDAHKQSDASGDLANQGKQVIDTAVAEIREIARSVESTSKDVYELGQHSNQISSVLQVIKEVADQTNLLALNAAIEAARAGEQGRGFAVVADEVRKLAERTAHSTEEIHSMMDKIQSSVHTVVGQMKTVESKVTTCQGHAVEAEQLMTELRNKSSQIIGAIGEVSSALKEQSSANQLLARNVESIAQSAEENSNATATAAEQARQVDGLAGRMQSIIAGFVL